MVTSFLVCGLIDTPNPSTGPPLPILIKKIFDHIAKIAPTKKNREEIMYRSMSEQNNTLPENKKSNWDNLYNPNGIRTIKIVNPKI